MNALLVSIAAPRLRQLGIRVPEGLPHPEEALFDRLEEMHGDGAHSRYNALIRRMVSFSRAATIAERSTNWRRMGTDGPQIPHGYNPSVPLID